MTSKTRKTRAQLIVDTAWMPALAAGATLTALHLLDHGIIGGILSISQVAAVFVVAVAFGLFRKTPRRGIAIWLGRFVGYGLLGLVYQTLMGGLAGILAATLVQGMDVMPDRGLALYATLETIGLVAILLPGLVAFVTRSKGEPGAGSEAGVTAG